MSDTPDPSPAVDGPPFEAPTLPPAEPVSRTATFPGLAPADAATLPPAPPAGSSSATGLVAIPDYEVLGELGRGGMGVVYRARQVGLNRLVALKMILAGGHASVGELARFRTEAEAIAQLQHSNIVQVYEVGEQHGLPYFSLEFCGGGSLAARLDGTPWEPRRAAALVETLARAMQAAHARQIVHRDLKPANVLLASGGCEPPGESAPGGFHPPLADLVPKITDFGLAKRLDSGTGQTASGAILGTPSYMAPEQPCGDGKHIGPAADVYALGAILYELLTGRPPFRAATPLDTVLQVVSEEPVPPARLNSKTPRDLETICLKCLAKEPAKRYASAEALVEDLRRYQAGEPIAARPAGRLERGWRWCRRNRALAGALAAVALSLVLGTVASTAFGVRANRYAEQARDEKRTAQSYLYAARMNLIQMAWENNSVDRVLDLLETTKPKPGEEDLRGFEWHYWDRMCHSDLLTLNGHTDNVLSVAYSPDGSRLASSDSGGAVKVWDTATNRELLTLKPYKGVGAALAFSPDGRQLVGAAGDVRVWNAVTGRELLTLTMHTGRGLVRNVAFSPDGRQLATGSWEIAGTVRVWDAATGHDLWSRSGHRGGVVGVAYSPDGVRVASAGMDKTVRMWDAATGRELWNRMGQGHTNARGCVFSPDGTRLARATARIRRCGCGRWRRVRSCTD
jgi:hypothetical protein